MDRRRVVFFAVAALVVIGLFFAISGSMQRNAWMEGYIMGRLTAAAGVEGALAPMMPTAPSAYGYPQQGSGLGGLIVLFFGAGLIFLVASRFWHMARWQAWAMQGGQPGEQRHGPPPWMHHGQGCWMSHGQPTQEQAPSQPVQPEVKPAEEQPNR